MAEDGSDGTDRVGGDDPELDALLSALALKDERRTGWQRRGVSDPETVAGHSWGVAYLCLVLGDRAARSFRERGERLDIDRAVRIAVVHDLAEAETGDVPRGEADPARKRRRERAAMDRLAGPLPDAVRAAWEGYEADDPAAAFVADLDLLEPCLQAVVYEREGRRDGGDGGDADDFAGFFETARAELRTPFGRELLDRLRERYRAESGSGSGPGLGSVSGSGPGGESGTQDR